MCVIADYNIHLYLQVDGRAIVRLTMRDLMAMGVGSMLQRRALLKFINRSKGNGVQKSILNATQNLRSINHAVFKTKSEVNAFRKGPGSRKNSIIKSVHQPKIHSKSKKSVNAPMSRTHSLKKSTDNRENGKNQPVTIRETVSQLRNKGRQVISARINSTRSVKAAAKRSAVTRRKSPLNINQLKR